MQTQERTPAGALIKRKLTYLTLFQFEFLLKRQTAGWQRLVNEEFLSVWKHEEKRQFITYCEGDVIINDCPTPEIFAAEEQRILNFH